MSMRASILRTFFAALAVFLLASGARAQAPASSRLALVIGEAAYADDQLPTTGNDAALVSQGLRSQGFDVTELHDLNTAALASGYRAFIAKASAAQPGAVVAVYLGGIAVQVNCDDVLLPIDAHISQIADVTRVGLPMTRVFSDLSRTNASARLVMLDGARQVPASVSAIEFPPGLIGLPVPPATSFALSAEVHDFVAPTQSSDVYGPYAAAISSVLPQPIGDIDTFLSEVRVHAHQATAGTQTPWQATGKPMQAISLDITSDAAQIQAAAATLPNSSAPLSGMAPEDAYWAAIWRNSVAGYTDYLAAFSATGSPELVTRAQELLQLLQEPNPQCARQAQLPPPPPAPVYVAPPHSLPVAPPAFVGGLCPQGYFAENGYDESHCVPIVPPPVIACPPGFAMSYQDDQGVCLPLVPPPQLSCPPGFHQGGNPPLYCLPNIPMPWCPIGFTPHFVNGQMYCTKNGPPVPICGPGSHPQWNGAGWSCVGNPPPPPVACGAGTVDHWNGFEWVCVLPPAPPGGWKLCAPPQHPVWNGNQMVCQPLGLPPICMNGKTWSPLAHACVDNFIPPVIPHACPAGTEYYPGLKTCLPPPSQLGQTCPPGQVHPPGNLNACVAGSPPSGGAGAPCPTGETRLFPAGGPPGGQCVPTGPAPCSTGETRMFPAGGPPGGQCVPSGPAPCPPGQSRKFPPGSPVGGVCAVDYSNDQCPAGESHPPGNATACAPNSPPPQGAGGCPQGEIRLNGVCQAPIIKPVGPNPTTLPPPPPPPPHVITPIPAPPHVVPPTPPSPPPPHLIAPRAPVSLPVLPQGLQHLSPAPAPMRPMAMPAPPKPQPPPPPKPQPPPPPKPQPGPQRPPPGIPLAPH